MEKTALQKKIYSKIDELPTLSAIIMKLLALIENSQSNIHDLTEEISKDPALTAKILKVANSAYYGFPKEVTSLDRAVALLGFNMVKTLALSIGTVQQLPIYKKNGTFSEERLWIHALAVATIMKEIQKKFGKGVFEEYLFVIGLLHDIGIIVLHQFFSDIFKQILEEADTRDLPWYIVEKEILGFDHGEIGAMLLERWNFPDLIRIPVKYHHSGEIEGNGYARDIALLKVADGIVHGMHLGDLGEFAAPEINAEDLATLHLQEEHIEEMRHFLEGMQDSLMSLFHAMV